MTRLEAMCRELRAVGRPDAAQILEGWGPEDWRRCGKIPAGLLQESYSGEVLRGQISAWFSWVRTPEGFEFWDEVHWRMIGGNPKHKERP